MSRVRSFLRGFFKISSSPKELAEMEQKINYVLENTFDCDKEIFIRNTEFVPKLQTRVNELLFIEASVENANRIAELSVVLDRLQSYRTGEDEELMLIPKKHRGRSLLNFNIVRVTGSSRRFATKLINKSKNK